MGLFRNHKTKKEHRSRSLFQSLCVSMASIVLSLVMLVGTTMAWFTDQTVSATSTIKAGRIGNTANAVSVMPVSQMSTMSLTGEGQPSWQALPTEGQTALFGEGVFNPGTVRTVCIKLENNGDLPTRYSVALIMEKDSNVTLSEKLMFVYKRFLPEQPQTDENRQAAQEAMNAYVAGFTSDMALLSAEENGVMPDGQVPLIELQANAYFPVEIPTATLEQKGDICYYAFSIYLPSDATTSEIGDKGVNVYLEVNATQMTAENVPEAWDGIRATASEVLDGHEENGVISFTVNSPADLAGVANILRIGNAGQTYIININADLDMNHKPWTPIDTLANVQITGNNHILYNLDASGEASGLFGTISGTLTVSNWSFSGGSSTGYGDTGKAGMLAGDATSNVELTCLKAQNVQVKASTAKVFVGQGSGTETGFETINCTIATEIVASPESIE